MAFEKDTVLKLMLDTRSGRVESYNYSTREASEAIRQEFVDLLGTDNPDYRTFRKHKADIFEIIEIALDQSIEEGMTDSNNAFFEQFVEYRNVNLGDKNEFYVEDNSMLVISEVADGHIDLRRQILNGGTSFTVTTRSYGAKVYADFLRFLAGRVDWNKLVSKIDEAMKHKMASDIYASFLGATSYLPAEFKTSGSFDGDKLNTIIQHVQASNGYSPIIIAGTRSALKKINAEFTGTNGFLLSDNMKDQLHGNGVLAHWEGIPLLEIPQVHIPNTFDFQLDDNKLMILPNNVKPIKIVKEGESYIHEVQEGTNKDLSKEYTFLTRYGIVVVFNVLYGMYELS